MDRYLTLDPTITLWRYRYAKHTYFVFEPIMQPFVGARFGNDFQISLNRTGDLLYYAFAVFDIPAIVACTAAPTVGRPTPFPEVNPCDPCGDGPETGPCQGLCGAPVAEPVTPQAELCAGIPLPYAYWTNAIGQYLVERVCLVVGGVPVDTLYNDYLYMWEELSGKPGKRLIEMIGKRFTIAQLVHDSMYPRRLYCPLPFWFTYISGNALALASLQFHTIQLMLLIAHLDKCIQTSPLPDADIGDSITVLNCNTGQPST
eukprot:gnl/Hemi2/10579_TR3661_c0_g1_i2.p3 gnl/Hemi2/10579_TR3661_c0_g1~~gnl/Hemi2/10579_TR3661_c0_g1_i2.p3  ORF type:complete len:259 (+),score=74.03 gnl/Hemi2/10579_TR3661_c0_g1_i2:584-1360(+)